MLTGKIRRTCHLFQNSEAVLEILYGLLNSPSPRSPLLKIEINKPELLFVTNKV
jgi:hypothetical protein